MKTYHNPILSASLILLLFTLYPSDVVIGQENVSKQDVYKSKDFNDDMLYAEVNYCKISQALSSTLDDPPAVIYFYRPGKTFGAPNDIYVGIVNPFEQIVSLGNGRWYKVDYLNMGPRELFTGIFSTSEQKLNITFEPGKTYYIRCSIMKGMGMQSQIEEVDEATAQTEMKKLKEQKKAK